MPRRGMGIDKCSICGSVWHTRRHCDFGGVAEEGHGPKPKWCPRCGISTKYEQQLVCPLCTLIDETLSELGYDRLSKGVGEYKEAREILGKLCRTALKLQDPRRRFDPAREIP
jgi:hypothetical protein